MGNRSPSGSFIRIIEIEITARSLVGVVQWSRIITPVTRLRCG